MYVHRHTYPTVRADIPECPNSSQLQNFQIFQRVYQTLPEPHAIEEHVLIQEVKELGLRFQHCIAMGTCICKVQSSMLHIQTMIACWWYILRALQVS